MEWIAGYLDTNSPDSSELSSERDTAASLNIPTPQKEYPTACCSYCQNGESTFNFQGIFLC